MRSNRLTKSLCALELTTPEMRKSSIFRPRSDRDQMLGESLQGIDENVSSGSERSDRRAILKDSSLTRSWRKVPRINSI